MNEKGQSLFEVAAILGTVCVVVTLTVAGVRQYRPADYAHVMKQYSDVSRDLSWSAERRLGGSTLSAIVAGYRSRALAEAQRMPESHLASAADPLKDLAKSIR